MGHGSALLAEFEAAQGADDGYRAAGTKSALKDYIRRLEEAYEATAMRAKKLAMYRLMGEDLRPDIKNETYNIARSILGPRQVELALAELAGRDTDAAPL